MSLALVATLAGVFAAAPQASAAKYSSALGANCTSGSSGSPACSASSADPISGSGGILHKATQFLAIITGMAAVIMMVVGGMMYVLSGGDSARINTAKNTLIYASIGVVITLIAQSIVVFVINKT